MGRILKIKRHLIEESNKQLLGEDIPPEKDPNAGEIQKYLVEKGYLPRYRVENGVKKDNIDWDFGDVSAKAFGDFIKDKLGVDVGVKSLQDLQDYLDILGFSTGGLGFGEKVYTALKWLIDFIGKTASNLINEPKINEMVISIINNFSKNLIGKQITKIDEHKEGKNCDTHVNYFSKITDVELTNISNETFSVKGSVMGDLKVGACEILNIPNSYQINKKITDFTIDYEAEFKYHLGFKDGKFCFFVDVNTASVNSPSDRYIGRLPGVNTWYFYLNIDMNNVNIENYMSYFPSKTKKYKGGSKIATIPTVKEIKKSICGKGYCIKIDDIIKLITGEESVNNLSNLMVDMCTTKKTPFFIDSPLPPDTNAPPQRHFMG